MKLGQPYLYETVKACKALYNLFSVLLYLIQFLVSFNTVFSSLNINHLKLLVMKTTYPLTLLAIIIHAMAIGQTSGQSNHKIRVDIFAAKQLVKTIPALQKVSDLQKTIPTNIIPTHTKNNSEIELQELKNKYILSQIELSTLKAENVYRAFNKNVELINQLLFTAVDRSIQLKSETLTAEACLQIKNAKEIREEAAAQATLQAYLSELSNAEENEKSAIEKQYLTIKLLTGSNKNIKQTTEIIPAPIIATTLIKQEDEFAKLKLEASQTAALINELEKVSIQKSRNEKIVMEQESQQMKIQLLTLEIKIASKNSDNLKETFRQNSALLLSLLPHASEKSAEDANALIQESNYTMRLAKEMEEEAFAQFTTSATLAELSNANEKENSALKMQVTALKLLEKTDELAVNK